MTPLNLCQRGAIPVLALALGLTLTLTLPVHGQSVVNSANFFEPTFGAETDGPGGVLSITVDTVTEFTAGPQSSGGSPTWNHSATGLIEAGVIILGEATLSTTTSTTGSSLVFGRELGLTGTLGILNPLVSDVLGTSLLSNWGSTALVGGLSLDSGNAYTVTFDVTEGAGLDVAALTAANFSLLGNGSPIAGIDANTTLDLLGLLTLGGTLSSFEFTFIAPEPLTSLEFQFDATALADASLLGGTDGNQNVLTFSNLAVTPVPEPGSLTLLGLGMYFLLRRRNRV